MVRGPLGGVLISCHAVLPGINGTSQQGFSKGQSGFDGVLWDCFNGV